MIPLVRYRREAGLRVHEEIVGNGKRELVTIAAKLQEKRRFDIGILTDECLVPIRIVELDPGRDRKTLGRVQDGRSDIGVAAGGTGKVQSVRTDNAGRPTCSAEQGGRMITG
jgi:hypothetical protein